MSLALVIQHAKHMHFILLSLMACLAVPNFPHCLINGTIFGKMLMNIECMFSFHLQPLSETFLILRRTEHITIKIYLVRHVIHPLLLSDLSET